MRLVLTTALAATVAMGSTAAAEPPLSLPAPADVAEIPLSAVVSETGVGYRRLRFAKPGNPTPGRHDTVVVHYTGWTTDGEMFDSSVLKGEPAEFPLTAVIKGWTLGVGLMVEGEKRRLWIPEKLAYKGEEGKPAGMLVFDVELVEIK